MNKRKIHYILFLLIGVLLFSSTSFVYGKEQITKTYTFHPKTEKNLSYDVPKTITKNGKKYELVDVKYQVDRDKTVTKTETVITADKEDYPKTITENGVELKITSDPVKWEEVKSDAVIIKQEYRNKSDIPSSITSSKADKEGEKIDITLTLTNTDQNSRSERFSAPAVFYSPEANSRVYMFNGKRVTISGNSPTWSGYEQDVKDYLGLNGNSYAVTGGSWSAAATRQGDSYVRTATFTGTRTVPFYTATFTEDDTRVQYQADITYTNITAKAIGTYEPVTNFAKYIAIGAGLVILIAAAIALIYYLAKKKRQEKEDT